MVQMVERDWEASFEGMARGDRRGGRDLAFVPDPLCGWEFEIPARLAGNMADVEAAIRSLNAPSAVGLEGLADSCCEKSRSGLRGLRVWRWRCGAWPPQPRFLARMSIRVDQLAAEVAADVAAMEIAVAASTASRSFSLEDLLGIHRTLMSHSRSAQLTGTIRENQNWIGGSPYTGRFAVRASAAGASRRTARRLDRVREQRRAPAVAADSTVHAQFETIHPFVDGNSRTGRALIHVVLARRGLAPRFVPPVSVVLARRRDQYISHLQRFAHIGPAGSPDRRAAAVDWLWLFDAAMAHACDRAADYCDELAQLQRQWRHQVGAVRSNSSADRLLRVLPGAPVLTVEWASALIGVSPDRVGPAINTLATAGVLAQRNLGRQRYRVFEAPDVLALWAATDADLAAQPPDPN